MTLNKTTTTASTSRKWINPPAVTEVTIPNNHRITSTTTIVSSICFLRYKMEFQQLVINVVTSGLCKTIE